MRPPQPQNQQQHQDGESRELFIHKMSGSGNATDELKQNDGRSIVVRKDRLERALAPPFS
jgi:hypothetical protein